MRMGEGGDDKKLFHLLEGCHVDWDWDFRSSLSNQEFNHATKYNPYNLLSCLSSNMDGYFYVTRNKWISVVW